MGLAILIGFDQSLLQLAKMIDITKLFPGFKWGPLLVNGGIAPPQISQSLSRIPIFLKNKKKKREKMIDIIVYSLMNYF